MLRSVRRIPLIGDIAVRLVRAMRRRRTQPFRSSGSYWEERYRSGGNSGAGSYQRLAHFKASVLNEFVDSRDVQSILELGCGDGSQLALAAYPSYVGVDVAPAAVDLCRGKFRDDPTKTFLVAGDLPAGLEAELVLSLDVIYHLVEDDVFDAYMASLFEHAAKYVIIYASNEDRPTPDPHVRHRKFTDWIDDRCPDWMLTSVVPNAHPFDPARPDETSAADFYFYEKVSG